MPVTTSRSNNVASDLSVIKFKQDAASLWLTVRDVTNEECAFLSSHLSNHSHARSVVAGGVCSPAFMRLPSKRQYDVGYYRQIQDPVTPHEIKSRIETE